MGLGGSALRACVCGAAKECEGLLIEERAPGNAGEMLHLRSNVYGIALRADMAAGDLLKISLSP
jgi:hypothetical protein